MTWDRLTPPYSTIVADPPWEYDEHAYGRPDRAFLPYSSMAVEEIAAMPVADLAGRDAHLYLWTTNRYIWDARDVALAWGFTPSQVLVWCKQPTQAVGGTFSINTEFIVYGRSMLKEHRQVERASSLIRAAREAAGLSRAEVFRLVFPHRSPTGLVRNWEYNLCVPNRRDWQRLQQVLPALAGVERPHVEPPPPREVNRVDRNWWTWPRGPHSEKPAAFLDVVERVSPGPYVELFARQPRLGWDSWGWGYEQAVG